MSARSDLFAAAVNTNRTLVTSASEPAVWTMGGRVLCLHAVGSRVRLRQIEVSRASIATVTLRVGSTGVTKTNEGSDGTPVSVGIGNLNQEGNRAAAAVAYSPAADKSNYGCAGTVYNILVSRIMANVPVLWRFDHHEVRLGINGSCVLRVSPASNGDVVTATLIWEELD